MDGYELTTDVTRVDLDRVHTWLSEQSYWALGRERDVLDRAVAGSRIYAALQSEQTVAFARAVTDGATFCWVCDVFVDETHRGRGLGQRLVDAILHDLGELGVQRFLLATRDAHEVYRRSGFEPLVGADRWMEIDRRPQRAAILDGTY